MRLFSIIFAQEMRLNFYSYKAIVVITVFLFLFGAFLFNYMDSYIRVVDQHVRQISVESVLFGVFNILQFFAIMITPVLTMGSIAGEYQNKTHHALLSYPISLFQLIIIKFFSLLLVFFVALLLTLPLPIYLYMNGAIAWQLLLSMYVGFVFLLSFQISVGIFASAIFKNQPTAYMTAFLILAFLLLSDLFYQSIKGYEILFEIVHYIAISTHYVPFLKGSIDSVHIVYFFSFTLLFLVLSAQVLEHRKWSRL